MLNKRKYDPVEPSINDLAQHFKQLNQLTSDVDEEQEEFLLEAEEREAATDGLSAK